jgi:outer membrane cobalamin receptor
LVFIFLFTLLNLWAQPEIIPPVEVESEEGLWSWDTTRSVSWPQVSEPLNDLTQLPQFDDALNSSNGLQVRTQGSPSFSIRGSAQNGRALVLYDHIPLNFASGFGAPAIFLPKETLSRLVIVKGPASLFYGSQAMAGAVDFISKHYTKPEINLNFSDTNESFLPWREGGLGHQSYQLATPVYQSDKTHVQASLFYDQNDGVFPFQNRDARGVRENNGQKTVRMVVQGHHKSESWALGFNSILSRQNLDSPGPINFPFLTEQESEGVLLSLAPHVYFTEDQSFKTRITYMNNPSRFLENGQDSFSNQVTTSVQNEWIYDLSESTTLQVFADGFVHSLDNSFVGQDLKQENLEAGPFLEFASTEHLFHQVGFRYLISNDQWLPTLSTHYRFSGLKTWVSYAEGFRNPTLTDLFSQSPFFVGNENLRAETSKQFEWGLNNDTPLKVDPLRWEVRLFHMEYQNFIESVELFPGLFTRDNAGAGFSRGLDLDISKSYSQWTARLIYNFLETRSRQQQRPFRLSPRHQITAEVGYRWRSLNIEIQNTHWYDYGDLSLNQFVELEDWQQWNIILSYPVFKGGFVTFGIVNAFNEGKQLTVNYPEPQRQYFMRLHQKF